MEAKKLAILAVKAGNVWYITDYYNFNKYNASYKIKSYLYDGKVADPTLQEGWLSIKASPEKVERVIPGKIVNARYELKPEFPETDSTPSVIVCDGTWNEYSDESPISGKSDLYEYKYETEPDTKEIVDVQWTVYDAGDNFKIIKQDFPVEYYIFDKITTPSIALVDRPCKLTSAQSYKIIREYIKKNLNPEFAEITDYDFCLHVSKKIPLDIPEPYQSNIRPFSRKPKYETRYRKMRGVKVYEIAPIDQYGKTYSNITPSPTFDGNNYPELEKKLTEYLKGLVDEFNTPYSDCPHCKGMGVIIK